MKNYWLSRTNKTTIKIWLGSSITGGNEELLGNITALADDSLDRILVEDDTGKFSTNAKMSIPQEIDTLLWYHRVGKALAHRYETGTFNDKQASAQAIRELQFLKLD